jgi:putative DNA primase/helicase
MPGPAAEKAPEQRDAAAANEGRLSIDGPTDSERGCGLAYTELWLAQHLADFYGEDTKFCAERGSWFVWDNDAGLWRRDEQSLQTLRRIQTVCKASALFVRNDPRFGSEAAALRMARQIETARTVKGIEYLARSQPEVALAASSLDQDLWVLNTPGGLIDLRTGRVRSARREDYCTRTAAVALDEWGDCPEFFLFLEAITCGDEELQDWLQVFFGMLLTGDTSLHVLTMFIGSGRNGKSTLADLVLRIMGGYASKIASSVLMTDRHGNRHQTEIAQLMGLRAAFASEVNQGDRWDEAKIKELTGDEFLNARFMYRDNFVFRRTHRFLVLGNYRPQVTAIDPAIRGRLRLVPFRADFTGREDRELPERLWAEAGAILAWMVEGARLWCESRRLPPCKVIEDETGDYFESQSTVENWIELELELQGDARSKSGELYRAYRAWKEARGEFPLSLTVWGQTMAKRFKKRVSDGVWYLGVQLRHQQAGSDEGLPL